MTPTKAPEGDDTPLRQRMPRKLRCVRCGRPLRGEQKMLCNYLDCRTGERPHMMPTSYKLTYGP